MLTNNNCRHTFSKYIHFEQVCVACTKIVYLTLRMTRHQLYTAFNFLFFERAVVIKVFIRQKYILRQRLLCKQMEMLLINILSIFECFYGVFKGLQLSELTSPTHTQTDTHVHTTSRGIYLTPYCHRWACGGDESMPSQCGPSFYSYGHRLTLIGHNEEALPLAPAKALSLPQSIRHRNHIFKTITQLWGVGMIEVCARLICCYGSVCVHCVGVCLYIAIFGARVCFRPSENSHVWLVPVDPYVHSVGNRTDGSFCGCSWKFVRGSMSRTFYDTAGACLMGLLTGVG